ncbi:cell division protein CrgA [Corynebacterium sp. CNCTC7651]|uniref:cell division protein CrgA n=1 Tax=Corynebacterium sp. CNCTC7651 TaxID=2815361 RepID=UPI001F46D103|nr:cell division protein CrgA [Corynebacterium sp. CNCTC7651]UIZ92179.1 cell division protein CrgA [Corynebacterium sp. CNCTC7651]
MPKAKVTKDAARPVSSTSSGANRTPVKINTGGTPAWYKAIMFGLMIFGLAWLLFFYIAGDQVAFVAQLGPWNYAIGFAGIILGLMMTMGWR